MTLPSGSGAGEDSCADRPRPRDAARPPAADVVRVETDGNAAFERELADLGWLRRLARSLVRDDATADDVAQDACLAAVCAGPSRARSLRAWLAAVVRNAARRRHRDESRRTDRETAAARPEATPAESETVERLDAARAVVTELEALAEPYRTALRLRWIDGRTPAEVAAQTGVTPDVAWKRLSRGLATLRARLDRRFGGRAAWLLPVAGLGGIDDATLPWSPLLSASAAARPLVATALLLLVFGVSAIGFHAARSRAADAGEAAPAAADTRPGDNAGADDATAPRAGSAANAAQDAPARARRPRARVTAQPEAPEVAVAEPASAPEPEASPPPANRIVGRVLFPDGDPLPGAEIRRRKFGAAVGVRATTDAGGRFTLEHDADGRSDCVLAVDAGTLPTRIAPLPALVPGVIDVGDVRMSRHCPIDGAVRDSEGRPLPGALVSLLHPGDRTQVGTADRTRPDGRFRLDDAGDGDWIVCVMPPETAGRRWVTPRIERVVPGGTSDVVIVAHSRDRSGISRHIQAADEAGNEMPLEMKFPTSVGFCSEASFDDGRPSFEVVFREAPVGAAATVIARDLEPGEYTMWARTETLGPTLRRFTADARVPHETVRIVLSPPGAVRARVVVGDGSPLPPGARIAVGGVPGSPWGVGRPWDDGGIGGWATPREDGTFLLARTAPADYTLTLFAAGWAADPVPVSVRAGATTEVTLVARPGGGVVWEPEIPDGFEAEFAFAVGGGPFVVATEAGGTGSPSALTLPSFPPGRLRWRVRVAPRDRLACEGRPIATYTGDVTVLEGTSVTLPRGPFAGVR